MMRVLQVTIFLGLSAAVHAAVLVGVPGMGAEGAGENGTAQASIAASSARAQSLVQDWTRPPETGQIQGALPQAVSVASPSLPSLPRIDEQALLALPLPPYQPEPMIDSGPIVHDPAPQIAAPSLRPQQRPARPQPAEAPQAAQVARGSGGGQIQGEAPQASATPGLSAGQRNTLMSQWGAAIIARIERNRPNVAQSGAVSLRIAVSRDGTIEGLAIIGSSGDERLDQAALRAVQRARRFPAAPDGLTDASYRFDLPIRFQ